MESQFVTTSQAAKQMGLTRLRIQQLIWAKTLPAIKLGRLYYIKVDDLVIVERQKRCKPDKTTVQQKKEATAG